MKTLYHRQAEICEILNQYPGVLANTPGQTQTVVYAIDTGEHRPICTTPYRLCPTWHQEVKQEIDDLLKIGIIEPCVSPWSSPIVSIKKLDGSIRFCVDYRKINAITTPDPFCRPLTDDILDRVGECKFFFENRSC